MTGFICASRVYNYDGWIFEWHSFSGPWPLKKDGEPRKRAGRVFYKVIAEFEKLSTAGRGKYQVGGGCVKFRV